jgi:hypothetical protein
MPLDKRRGPVPQIAYEFLPCDKGELNVNAAFDLLFELVMRDLSTRRPPEQDVEKGTAQAKYEGIIH